MSLRLPASEMARLHAHLIAAYPEEGCGVLIGRDDGGARRVERVVGFANRHEEASGGHRYLLAPEQLLAAEREAREAGLDVVGFFHSHPDHPAHPSAFDLENAWPYYSYLIVSVVSGAIADTQAFRLADDRSRFDPEPVEPVAAAVGTE